MLLIVLLALFIIIISGITTIPFSVGLMAVSAVIFKKPGVFFLALSLGLFLDIVMIRPLGYTSLVLTIYVFLIRLYERKFETQTGTFVFISTLLGSAIYLWLFGYGSILLQSLVCAVINIFLFKFLIFNFKLEIRN